MIRIQNANFRYLNSDEKALSNVSLTIGRGECILLCGGSGCGKTTLTRLINGLIPHYFEGDITGSVKIDGMEITTTELYEMAHMVGSVFQNPRSQFFCVDTTSEIAFGCENIGLPIETIEHRVAEAVASLKIPELLGRNIFKLSGGEKQKIACASVSALHPDVFVFDEPSSNLDVRAIQSLKEMLLFWKSQGKTIIIAEHRLYWLAGVCDRVIYMQDGKVDFEQQAEDFYAFPEAPKQGLRMLSTSALNFKAPKYTSSNILQFCDYRFSYGPDMAIDIPSLQVPQGATIAIIGYNGSGKSSFTRCLCGLERKFCGTTEFSGQQYNRRQMLKKSYLVMQDVNHQLFCESVADEVRLGMNEDSEDIIDTVMERLGLQELQDRHPLSLSGGQKQRVAIAAALLADKEILIFDEPTSGLDFHSMERTSELLSSLRGEKTVLIVTHDPELIIRCCTHVLLLEEGKAGECYALAGHEKHFLSYFEIDTDQ